MVFLNNVLGRLLAVWAMLVFVITLIIVVVPALFIGVYPEPKRSFYMHTIFQVWMDVFFFFVFVKRIFKGREQFNKKETFIVVCNHNSFMDVPLSSPGIPEANKTIAKIEMARIPLFGLVYKRGSVLVDRKNERSRKESFVQMKKVLDMGLHMCIYPEGTRNKTTEPLQRFHDGAFKLSVDTGKAILPAVIFYTNKVLPRNKGFYFWPHKIEMHFLPPIYPTTVTELKEKTFAVMQDYYVQHRH